MKAYKTYIIDVPIYNEFVDLFLGNYEDLTKYTLKKYNVMVDNDVWDGSDACTINLTKVGLPGIVLIAIDHFEELSAIERYELLVHELVHATFFIMSNAGVPITDKNDETVAYITQYLFIRAYEIFKKLEKKMPPKELSKKEKTKETKEAVKEEKKSEKIEEKEKKPVKKK